MIEILIVTSIVSFVTGLCVGRLTKRDAPTSQPQPVETGAWCDICHQPANPLRTHLGHYRCTAHKQA